MSENFDWDERGPAVESDGGSPTSEIADRVRLDRHRRIAERFTQSASRWLLVLVIGVIYAAYVLLGLRRGLFPFDGNSWLLPISAVVGVGGLVGLSRFEASVGFYESINARYYRNRRRPIDEKLNALIGNVLFAGGGMGTVAGYALYYLLGAA